MIDSLTGLGNTAVKNFKYGHRPSVIMWEKTDVSVKSKDEAGSTLFGGSGARGTDEVIQEIDVANGQQAEKIFNTFKFDAVVSEEHDSQAIVTKFPVSSGFLVSDHIIKQNRMLRLTAVAANMQNASMWMLSAQGLSVATGAIFSNPMIPILGSVAGTVASAFETSNRLQSTFDLFNQFRAAGTLLYISTIAGPYLNCVVVGVRTKQDKMTSHILAVDVTFEELQVVDESDLMRAARTAMESMRDYSSFAKVAQSLGVGVAGGMPLPGLGQVGLPIGAQLGNLKEKLSVLNAPVSSVKGVLT